MDYSEATIKELEILVKNGDIEAIETLAYRYSGKCNFTKKDINKSMMYYEMGIQKGSVSCMHKLGVIHRFNNPVVDNYAKAMKYFIMASNKNCFNSMVHIGHMYTSRYMCSVDYGKAIEYYEMAIRCHENGYEIDYDVYGCGTYDEVLVDIGDHVCSDIEDEIANKVRNDFAIKCYENAIKFNNDNFEAMINLCRIYTCFKLYRNKAKALKYYIMNHDICCCKEEIDDWTSEYNAFDFLEEISKRNRTIQDFKLDFIKSRVCKTVYNYIKYFM